MPQREAWDRDCLKFNRSSLLPILSSISKVLQIRDSLFPLLVFFLVQHQTNVAEIFFCLVRKLSSGHKFDVHHLHFVAYMLAKSTTCNSKGVSHVTKSLLEPCRWNGCQVIKLYVHEKRWHYLLYKLPLSKATFDHLRYPDPLTLGPFQYEK